MKFSEETLKKAHRLIDRGAVETDQEHRGVWWVPSGSDAQIRYRVQSDYNPETRALSWVTCTCPHGLNAGAGTTHCYHAAAVLLTLMEEIEPNQEIT